MSEKPRYSCKCKECGREFLHENKDANVCFDCCIKLMLEDRHAFEAIMSDLDELFKRENGIFLIAVENGKMTWKWVHYAESSIDMCLTKKTLEGVKDLAMMESIAKRLMKKDQEKIAKIQYDMFKK